MSATPEPVKDFLYYDGVQTVHGDRLAIFRQIRIHTHGRPNELDRIIARANPATSSPEQIMEALQAEEQLVAMIRIVFHMQPFNPSTGQGAREEHCWTVWEAFKAVMSDEKKNGATPPIVTQPSAPPEQPTPSISA